MLFLEDKSIQRKVQNLDQTDQTDQTAMFSLTTYTPDKLPIQMPNDIFYQLPTTTLVGPRTSEAAAAASPPHHVQHVSVMCSVGQMTQILQTTFKGGNRRLELDRPSEDKNQRSRSISGIRSLRTEQRCSSPALRSRLRRMGSKEGGDRFGGWCFGCIWIPLRKSFWSPTHTFSAKIVESCPSFQSTSSSFRIVVT